MPRFRIGRRSSSQSLSNLEQIGPALLPAAALTAVPFINPGPRALEGRALTLALNVFDTLSVPSSSNAALGEPSAEHAGASADSNNDSFEEDMDMEEAGYTTVPHAPWSHENKRKSYSDRERVPTPPSIRNVATEGHVTQSGDVYHILEPDEADPVETDIYAVPVKSIGPGKMTVENEEEDDVPLDRTQQEVRKAMQAIHDTPVEETMMSLAESRQATQPQFGSSSGRGTMWQDDDDEEDSDDEPPPLPPPPVDHGPAPEAKASSPQPASEAEVSSEAASENKVTVRKVTVKQAPVAGAVPEPQIEVKEVMVAASRQEVQSPRSTGSGSAAVSSSQFSATPRDAPSLPLEHETKPMKAEPQNQHLEVVGQRKMSGPVRNGAGGSGSSRHNATPRQALPSSLPKEVEQVTRHGATPQESSSMSLQREVRQAKQSRTTPQESSSMSMQREAKQAKQSHTTPQESLPMSMQRETGQAKQSRTTPQESSPMPMQREAGQATQSRTTPQESSPMSMQREAGQATQPRTTPQESSFMSMQREARQAKQSRTTPQESSPMSMQREAGHATQPRTSPKDSSSMSLQREARQATHPRTSSQEALSLTLQREVEQMKKENQDLHQEVVSLRNMVVAVGTGREEGSGRRASESPVVEDLKNENEVLKNTVGRLNQELSQYQAAFRPLSPDDRSKLQGLPQKGPVPTWLINKQYLAPLFLAYDDLIQEKEGVIQRCHTELQSLKKRTEEVVRENQRYQLQGSSAGTGSMGAIHASDWQALQEQARLVLEENQILTEQLDLQQRKVKDLCSSHMHQVGRLTNKLTTCEQEREEIERELEEVRSKLKDIKQKHDKLQLETVKQMTMHGHVNTVADLQRSVVDEREQFEKEKEEMVHKLMASDEERKRQTLAAIEAGAENKRLRAEVSAMHSAVRRSQNKLVLLQKAIRQSESKELVTQNELANVIKMVEKTALERDTAFRVAKEKERDCKNTVSQIVGSTVIMGKMEEKLKMYKLKASAKLQTVSERLKEQDDVFNRQRQEYEREISYLRSLLNEKEEKIEQMKGEKRDAEENLETVWQAARLENQHLKDTLVDSVHKLRKHPGLHTALEEEETLERLLHFST